MATQDHQPGEDRPTRAHWEDPAGEPPVRAPGAGEPPHTPAPLETGEHPAGDSVPEPAIDPPAELPIFGGINPPVGDWYRNPEAEAINRARTEAEDAAASEQLRPIEESQEGLDEEFLNNRRRRQELLSHLFSPFYILPLFVLTLLLGIATVNITIPESATVRVTIGFVNYNNLVEGEPVEFQLDQDRMLKSDEMRAMTRGILSQGPQPVDPSYVLDTLEYHRAVDRKWLADGRLELTVRSEDPESDVVRLRTMAQAYVALGELRKQNIDQYRATVRALEARNADAEKRSADLRQQIDDLAPAALLQSPRTADLLATEQYISRLAENAPERVAAARNLEQIRQQVKVAREAGEQRDKLLAQRIEVIQQISDTAAQIAQKRELAARVVYPTPFTPADLTVTDLRPESYRALWVVTVVICAIFTILVALAYLRNLRRETATLGRATADATAPD